jgi:tRNA uridine 5-carboxymethylaminomethyl modification enzyme
VRGQAPLILDRSRAYIGVLIDDLVTRGTREPYRLFTSRAEYRLLLREDNADLRLTEIGRDLGLVGEEAYRRFTAKKAAIEAGVAWLEETPLRPTAEVNARLAGLGSSPLGKQVSLAELLRRPELDLAAVARAAGVELQVAPEWLAEVQLQVKYAGYIQRQQEQVERFRKFESYRLPVELDYAALPGLSNEVVEKLSRIRPLNLGQASRISGITPAAIAILQVHLRKLGLL